ncbi:MAG: aminotransferase class III-fold pyridoxal phosphate-dependent enzyme [archaeon]|jgi:4-aminobutyrate aminotransferase/diaminobutyrate-pyruvate transaminase/4-aminobutyrate aminotransferase/(S)-3-amino-2-methylpropionate transaminase
MYNFNLTPKEVPKIHTKYRNIQTKLPVPESLEIIERSMKYEPKSMCSQMPNVWDKAIGYNVYDAYGNKWIDFSSTIFLSNIGHGNSDVVDAIDKMIHSPLLSSYDYFTEVRSLLAEKLVKMTKYDGMEKVFLLSTGSETCECALRLVTLYGKKRNVNKDIIISYQESFHGKTLGSQMLIGKGIYNNSSIIQLKHPTNFLIQMEEQDDEEYGRWLFKNDMKELMDKIDINNICSFIFNPYIGSTAVFYPIGYIKAMRDFADSIDALIISDDIQSGFFRTGYFLGYQYYGIKPDIICCGKAISGSLPLSAVLTRSEIMDLDNGLSSTHSGSPVSCVATLANLEYMEKNISKEMIKDKEQIIKDVLYQWKQKFPSRIKSYHGNGMVWGIMIVKPDTQTLDIDFVDKIVEKAFIKGVILIRTGVGTIKLGMPLITPNDVILEGLSVIEESISELLKEGLYG